MPAVVVRQLKSWPGKRYTFQTRGGSDPACSVKDYEDSLSAASNLIPSKNKMLHHHSFRFICQRIWSSSFEIGLAMIWLLFRVSSVLCSSASRIRSQWIAHTLLLITFFAAVLRGWSWEKVRDRLPLGFTRRWTIVRYLRWNKKRICELHSQRNCRKAPKIERRIELFPDW